MKDTKQIFVTVGIPSLGREDVLLATIKMVLAQDYKNFELIVADQTAGHKPEFLKALEDLSAKDTRLRYYLISPPSLPAARNFILAKARGKILLFIDDDVLLKPNFVSTHINEHDKHPDATVIAGRVIQKGLPLSKSPLYFDKYGLPQGTFNCPTSGVCQDMPGGNHSVQVTAIQSIGGYHTAYKKDAVREESDTAYQLIKAGYKMFFSAEAALTHLSVPSGGSRIHKPQFDNYRFYINDLLFSLRTVKLRFLPASLFRRLRIYSGGSSLLSTRRFRRAGLFVGGLIVAFWCLLFQRKNFAAKEVS